MQAASRARNERLSRRRLESSDGDLYGSRSNSPGVFQLSPEGVEQQQAAQAAYQVVEHFEFGLGDEVAAAEQVAIEAEEGEEEEEESIEEEE